MAFLTFLNADIAVRSEALIQTPTYLLALGFEGFRRLCQWQEQSVGAGLQERH